MKIVVFSDIHGNAAALKALLELEPPAPDIQYIFLGDMVGYYPQEHQVLEYLKSIPHLIWICGNHDRYYTEPHTPEQIAQLCQKYGDCYKRVDPAIASVVSKLPTSVATVLNGRSVLLCHGSPADFLSGRIYPDTPLPDACETSVVICGHTHYRMLRQKGDTVYLNPGSLGQPRDGKGFSYCTIDENWKITFCSVPLNIPQFIKDCGNELRHDSYSYRVLEREYHER